MLEIQHAIANMIKYCFGIIIGPPCYAAYAAGQPNNSPPPPQSPRRHPSSNVARPGSWIPPPQLPEKFQFVMYRHMVKTL